MAAVRTEFHDQLLTAFEDCLILSLGAQGALRAAQRHADPFPGRRWREEACEDVRQSRSFVLVIPKSEQRGWGAPSVMGSQCGVDEDFKGVDADAAEVAVFEPVAASPSLAASLRDGPAGRTRWGTPGRRT